MSGRTPDDLIEVYVHDVVRNLMPKHRGDVAFELRALLNEGLHDKAREAGKLPDEALAIDYLRDFGRPADVAARYHMPITLIEPADTPAFLFFSIIGVSFANAMPYLDRMLGKQVEDRDWPEALWVVGVLVIVFAVMAYSRRRWPQKSTWTPHRLHKPDAKPSATIFALVLGALALLIYAFPGKAAELFGMSEAAPDRYSPQAFAFTDDFRTWRFPWVFVLAVPIFGLNIYAMAIGRWTRTLRWLEILFAVSLAVQLGWHAHIGNIVVGKDADNTARLALVMSELSILIQAAIRAWREWGRIDPPKGYPGTAAQTHLDPRKAAS